MSLSTAIIIILICLSLEAFFSGSELALISIKRFLLKNRADNGSLASKKIIKLLKNPSELIVITLLGTNFCTITMASVATLLVINTFGEDKTYLASLVIIPLTLILGELYPKKLGQKYSDQISEYLIYPILVYRILLYPIIFLLVKYANFLSFVLNLKDTQRDFVASRNELKLSLEDININSEAESEELKMIDHALDLIDIYAEDCMVPLVKVDALSEDASIIEALNLINEKGHSRIPIYKDRIDNIIGLIYSFDILKKDKFSDQVSTIMKETLYIPTTQPVDSLIKLFRNSGQHMAVVVDEYGGTVGIITLDDILEEVVGDLNDEFDNFNEHENVKILSENVYLIESDIEIEDLDTDFNIKIPEGDYISLGGYLLDLFEKIPKVGEKIEDSDNIYFIAKATNRKIEEVILSKKVKL